MGKNAAYQAQKAALGARSEEPPPPGTATGTERRCQHRVHVRKRLQDLTV